MIGAASGDIDLTIVARAVTRQEARIEQAPLYQDGIRLGQEGIHVTLRWGTLRIPDFCQQSRARLIYVAGRGNNRRNPGYGPQEEQECGRSKQPAIRDVSLLSQDFGRIR